MIQWLKTLITEIHCMKFMQGLLALIGFGTLTWGFIAGRVPIETYGPLVAFMVGFFFNAVTATTGGKTGGKDKE